MTSHFIVSHPGNKYFEFKQFEDVFREDDFENKKNIVEPFCGTGGMSLQLWKKYGSKFNYYLNDLDDKLFQIFLLYKSGSSLDEIFEKMNTLKHSIEHKEAFKDLNKRVNEDIYNYIVCKKLSWHKIDCYNIRDRDSYKIKSKPNKHQKLFFEFINSPNVFISNKDWYEVFKEFDNDNTVFLFDPPYIDSDNTFYKHKDLDVYEFFKKKTINLFKSKIFFIVEDIEKIRTLFKNNNVLKVYDKTYYLSKRKTKHIIISN